LGITAADKITADQQCGLITCDKDKVGLGKEVCPPYKPIELPNDPCPNTRNDPFDICELTCERANYDQKDEGISKLIFERVMILEIDKDRDALFHYDEVKY
jgi:hypothetical protein